jgi:hypothetical protein
MDTQHNNALHYAECRILFTVIIVLNVIMPSGVMLNVVMLRSWRQYYKRVKNVNSDKHTYLLHRNIYYSLKF